MGSTLVPIVTSRFVASNGRVQISDIPYGNSLTNSPNGSWSALYLYDGATRIAGPLAMTLVDPSHGMVSFALSGDGITIPDNESRELTLYGDVASWAAGAVSGSVHYWSVSTSGIVARAADSPSISVVATGTSLGNEIRIARTNLTMTGVVLGSATGRSRTAQDNLLSLTFTADPAAPASYISQQFMFSGSAMSYQNGGISVRLDDDAARQGWGVYTQWDASYNVWVATFILNPAHVVNPSGSWTLRFSIDSTSLINSTGADTLSINLRPYSWSDGATTFTPSSSYAYQFIYQ